MQAALQRLAQAEHFGPAPDGSVGYDDGRFQAEVRYARDGTVGVRLWRVTAPGTPPAVVHVGARRRRGGVTTGWAPHETPDEATAATGMRVIAAALAAWAEGDS